MKKFMLNQTTNTPFNPPVKSNKQYINTYNQLLWSVHKVIQINESKYLIFQLKYNIIYIQNINKYKL